MFKTLIILYALIPALAGAHDSRAVISVELEMGQCLIAGKDIKFRIEFQIRPSIAA